MTRFEAWLIHLSNLLVGGTGLVYAWMLYFAEPADEFSVVNHPLQPDTRSAHILLAPVLIFGCALVWRSHVWLRFRSGYRHRRKTGLLLAGLLWPMIVSGYLVQVAIDWRDIWIVIHVATSCLWILGYLVHQFLPKRRKGSGARSTSTV